MLLYHLKACSCVTGCLEGSARLVALSPTVTMYFTSPQTECLPDMCHIYSSEHQAGRAGRDTETVGCDPSLSSIPVRDQRSLASALAEVAAWLAAPGRGREVVLLYLDDQPDLLDWARQP